MKANKINEQPSNPTNEQRHNLLKSVLLEAGRLEDYSNIVKLLSPPTDILNYAYPGELKNIKVGIIGGGLAGMAAAFELRKLGCDITIFDALEDRIGGRVYTYYFDKNKKLYSELGAIRIPLAHETTWHYINLFGLNTNPFIQNNPNSFIYVNNTRTRNRPKNIERDVYPKYNLTQWERKTPWNKLYDYAVNFPMKKLTPNIRNEFLKILPKYNPFYNNLLNVSIRQNFQLLGLSPDAINLIASVDAFTGSLIDLSYNEILQDNYPVNFSYMYRIAGGNVNLPIAFYKSLISKKPKEYYSMLQYDLGRVIWKGGNWVTGIYKCEDEERVIIKHQNKKLPSEILEAFDYIVCAIPFSTLSTVEINPVFSNRKMQAIREINYVDAHRTLLLCNKRFWEEDEDYGRIIGGVSNTDLPITNILYPSDHAVNKGSPKEPGVLIASYNLNKYATHLGNVRPDLHVELVKRQVERVHGLPEDYLDSIVTGSKYIDWNSQEWFRGALAFSTPEQKRIFAYDILRPEYNNRVFFAGEHTSATHAWMQGALYSGMLAANKLAYSIKNKKSS